ncbi:MAG: signal peptidase II [Bacteroidales bacterium]|nr:signal peptidase II [Bacteroidales bacterium]
MRKRLFYSILVMALLVMVNLLFKEIAKNMESQSYILGILEFKFVKNYGMTLGIFEGNKYLIATIEITMLVISSLIFINVIRKSRSIYYISPIILFLSSGIGNVLDRFLNGYVTDYVRFNISSFTYFNMDDVLVIIGVSLFIYQSIFNNKMIGKIYSI